VLLLLLLCLLAALDNQLLDSGAAIPPLGLIEIGFVIVALDGSHSVTLSLGTLSDIYGKEKCMQ